MRREDRGGVAFPNHLLQELRCFYDNKKRGTSRTFEKENEANKILLLFSFFFFFIVFFSSFSYHFSQFSFPFSILLILFLSILFFFFTFFRFLIQSHLTYVKSPFNSISNQANVNLYNTQKNFSLAQQKFLLKWSAQKFLIALTGNLLVSNSFVDTKLTHK